MVALAISPESALAQTLVIDLRDEVNGVPIQGAAVSLLNRSGVPAASATSSDGGRAVLSPPAPGEYTIEVVRLGYMGYRTPLLSLATEGRVELELLIRPQPLGLEGVDVVTEGRGEELLKPLGLSAVALGSRWIDRADIDAMEMPGLPKDVIRWQGVPGVSVVETNTSTNLHPRLCVRIRAGGCALTVLNGSVVTPEIAYHLDPRSIEAMAILRPVEAATLYGTMGGSGAVLIWTRRGRP